MRINEIQNQIIKDMSSLDDWFDKYEYLIDLAKKFIPMDKQYKIEKNQIMGCQSVVWIYAELKNGKLSLSADSDAMITKGILALLLKVLNDQTPKNITEASLYFIDKIGLSSNLSPSRANGLASIVKQIKLYGMKYSKR